MVKLLRVLRLIGRIVWKCARAFEKELSRELHRMTKMREGSLRLMVRKREKCGEMDQSQ